jgi:anti-anti-sigma regulatory factor
VTTGPPGGGDSDEELLRARASQVPVRFAAPILAKSIVCGMASRMTELWLVPSPTGRLRGDHLCWPFRHQDELVAAARAYVAEGLTQNEQVAYLGEGRHRDLRQQLAGIPGVDDYVDRGQLRVVDARTLPTADPPSEPAEELVGLAAMTQESLDAGYAGLRMIADDTVRLRDPQRRAQHVHLEHLIDQFCLDHAFTGLCAYDVTVLGEDVVAEVACVHALARGNLSPFQLHATPRADVALAGSVDTFSVGHLATALQRIGVPAAGEQVLIDASALEFIDHRALLRLDQYAARRWATLVLRSPPRMVARLMGILPLRAVRLEATP